MRKGDVIKGYRVLVDPTNASGGQCRWSFAERDGRQYFIKEFLTPKYPTADSPGSAVTKEKKLEECKRFEDHHRQLMEALADLTARGGGGNLITAIDLFLWNTTYFKITEKVDVATVSLNDIARRPLRDRLLLLLTVSHSVEMLHRKRIVHGDLKPSNILVKVTPKRELTAKLIDFDNAFIALQPPEDPEEVVGDFSYYSPELFRYISGRGERTDVDTASDIFALGLIFTEYLTGCHPAEEHEEGYACVVADKGTQLRVRGGDIPEPLRTLVEKMLDARGSERPTINEVFSIVKAMRSKEPVAVTTKAPAIDRMEERDLGSRDRAAAADTSVGTLRGVEKFRSTSRMEKPEEDAEKRESCKPGVLRGLEKFKPRDA